MNVEIKKLTEKDLDTFVDLVHLFEAVFEMQDFQTPEENHLQRLLEKEGFLVFVALMEGSVVGGVTAYSLTQYYSTKPLVYIYDLAVDSKYQRQGIGRKLISEINYFCKTIGVEEVFVQADEVDVHALEFYRQTGGTAEKVVHFTYPLNR